MIAHTPGPWAVNGSHIYAPDGTIIAQVKNPGRRSSDYPLVANRNLMAAAPDLLEALMLALKQMTDLEEVLRNSAHQVYGWHLNGAPEPAENFFAENDHGAIEAARAAIAKATQP